jgi:hypothetical protein
VGPGFSPLAEALDLGPERLSPWLLERAVRLGAELPFATAASILTQMTGAHISASTIRRATLASGTVVHQLELAFLAEVEAGTAPTPPVPTTPLQLSVDGGMIPLVHGAWREARVLTIGTLTPDPAAAAPAAFGSPSYLAALCGADDFAREALGEVVRRGLDQAAQVVAVSDGATWIQHFVELHCPQALRILDFAHAAGYLAQAATEAFGADSAPLRDWFTAQRHALRHGEPEQVLAALSALPAGAARTDALRYLGGRRAMIAYRTFAAAGWPIGSGCVESAHKHVVQARLKRSGMHWTPEAVIPMLALRTTLANDRWEATWPRLGPHRRHLRHQQRAARHRARPALLPDARPQPPLPATLPPRPSHALPVPAPLAPVGSPRPAKPAADHPWRRPFLRPSPTPATKS